MAGDVHAALPAEPEGPLTCPRCGFTIWPRATWLDVRHCPRCIARSRTAVVLRPEPRDDPPASAADAGR